MYVLLCYNLPGNNVKSLKFVKDELKQLEFGSQHSSVPRASRKGPLQYAEESEEFSLRNASHLQPRICLANNRGNCTKLKFKLTA